MSNTQCRNDHSQLLCFSFFVVTINSKLPCARVRGAQSSGGQIAVATTFCRVAPNICGSSLWNLLLVTLVASTVFSRLLRFWEHVHLWRKHFSFCTNERTFSERYCFNSFSVKITGHLQPWHVRSFTLRVKSKDLDSQLTTWRWIWFNIDPVMAAPILSFWNYSRLLPIHLHGPLRQFCRCTVQEGNRWWRGHCFLRERAITTGTQPLARRHTKSVQIKDLATCPNAVTRLLERETVPRDSVFLLQCRLPGREVNSEWKCKSTPMFDFHGVLRVDFIVFYFTW